MKNVIKLEEVAMFLTSLVFFQQLDISWWWYAGLFLATDLSMLGYLVNTKVGAVAYNLAHHKGVALGFGFAGYYLGNEVLLFTGILLFGHSCLDRVFGYGLKYSDDYKHTHLGWLPAGKNRRHHEEHSILFILSSFYRLPIG